MVLWGGRRPGLHLCFPLFWCPPSLSCVVLFCCRGGQGRQEVFFLGSFHQCLRLQKTMRTWWSFFFVKEPQWTLKANMVGRRFWRRYIRATIIGWAQKAHHPTLRSAPRGKRPGRGCELPYRFAGSAWRRRKFVPCVPVRGAWIFAGVARTSAPDY